MFNQIYANEIKFENSMVSFLNGTNQFMIENPWFSAKGVSKANLNSYLEYKANKYGGGYMTSPKIYYLKDGVYTYQFGLFLNSKEGKKCVKRNFKFWDNGEDEETGKPKEIKSSHKAALTIQVKEGEEPSETDKILMTLFYQLNTVMELIQLCIVSDIKLSQDDTDNSILSKIMSKLNMKKSEELEENLNSIKLMFKNKKYPIYEKNQAVIANSDSSLINLFNNAVKNAIKTGSIELSGQMKNVVSRASGFQKPLVPCAMVARTTSIDKKTKEEKEYTNYTYKIRMWFETETKNSNMQLNNKELTKKVFTDTLRGSVVNGGILVNLRYELSYTTMGYPGSGMHYKAGVLEKQTFTQTQIMLDGFEDEEGEKKGSDSAGEDFYDE